MEKIQWTNEPGNYTDVMDFSKGKMKHQVSDDEYPRAYSASPLVWTDRTINYTTLEVHTPMGAVIAELYDWIVKDEEGNLSVEEGEELVTCECDKRTPIRTAYIDEEGIWACPECCEGFMEDSKMKPVT